MVYQQFINYPSMTVFENIASPLRVKRIPENEIKLRVQKVAELLKISPLLKRRPSELSGGQQQRTAIARALTKEAELVLLDEPLANLDAKLREEMRFFIRNLQKDLGITTIYVTHDQAESMVMSDRIVVMFNGRIHQIGRPAEIYNFPATQDIADFIGLSNFIACTVTGRENNDQYIVDTPAGTLRSTTNASHTVSSKVIMMVRPEVITLHNGSAEGAHNEITGTVAEKYYLGNVITYRIRYTDDAILQVQGQPWSKFEVGDPIWCRFDVERSWILPTDSG